MSVREKVKELYESGVTSPSKIAKELGVTRQTVYYHLKKLGYVGQNKGGDTPFSHKVSHKDMKEEKKKEEWEQLVDDVKEERKEVQKIRVRAQKKRMAVLEI